MSDPVEKVVHIRGGSVVSAGVPNPDAIQECEELLERLKSGEVQGFIYAQLWRDNVAGWATAGPTGCYAIVGALHSALNAAAHSADQ